MKICSHLVHLITLTTALALTAAAQAGLPKAQIVTLNLDPQNVTILHLRRGFVSSVRLPEEVSSVVLGDPGAFKAEHSEAEPQLVFFKPTHPKPAETNALITTRTGHEVSLSLVSEGNSDRGGAVDYVLKYEHPRSVLIGASHSSFVIGDTKSLTQEIPPISNAQGKAVSDEQELLRQQRLEAPHWEGKQRPKSIPKLFGWATPQGWRQGLRPGQEANTKSADPTPSGGADGKLAPQERNTSLEETNALIRQIEAMAEPLGKRLYRGLLKTVARVWNPIEIHEGGVLRKVLERMQAAERGLRRLEAALNRVGSEALVPILRSLRLDALTQVDNLDDLKKIVLAVELAAKCDG